MTKWVNRQYSWLKPSFILTNILWNKSKIVWKFNESRLQWNIQCLVGLTLKTDELFYRMSPLIRSRLSENQCKLKVRNEWNRVSDTICGSSAEWLLGRRLPTGVSIIRVTNDWLSFNASLFSPIVVIYCYSSYSTKSLAKHWKATHFSFHKRINHSIVLKSSQLMRHTSECRQTCHWYWPQTIWTDFSGHRSGRGGDGRLRVLSTEANAQIKYQYLTAINREIGANLWLHSHQSVLTRPPIHCSQSLFTPTVTNFLAEELVITE